MLIVIRSYAQWTLYYIHKIVKHKLTEEKIKAQYVVK